MTALIILIFWTHIEVTKGGISLKRGLGILNGQNYFIEDEEVDYVRVILTLKIHMLKIVMGDKTVRIDIDDLTNHSEFLDMMQEKYADKFQTLESTKKYV